MGESEANINGAASHGITPSIRQDFLEDAVLQINSSSIDDLIKNHYWDLPKEMNLRQAVIDRIITHLEEESTEQKSFIYIKRLTKVADLIGKEDPENIGVFNTKLYDFCVEAIEMAPNLPPRSVEGGQANLENMVAHLHGYAAGFSKYQIDMTRKLLDTSSQSYFKNKTPKNRNQMESFKDKTLELHIKAYTHSKKQASLASETISEEYKAHSYIHHALYAKNLHTFVCRTPSYGLERNEEAVELAYQALIESEEAFRKGISMLETIPKKRSFTMKMVGSLGEVQKQLYLITQDPILLEESIKNNKRFIAYHKNPQNSLMKSIVQQKKGDLDWMTPLLEETKLGSHIRITRKEDYAEISVDSHEEYLLNKSFLVSEPSCPEIKSPNK
ncbi:hypothetical protein GOV05_02925 [Candidatus Woesearchaeota archaeon]|nr:hypothetical protein [Candidatus Woesearchaeota archaeon]